MMTKKTEMAEWILDFFRRAKVNSGQIIMFRTLQNKLLELSPKERELFVPVANELIENGYFSYEEGASQSLRLSDKGSNYIYNPDAILDCCHDQWKPNKAQSQYLANWHDNFVNFINSLLSVVALFEVMPQATEKDKQGFEMLKLILHSSEVQSIEEDLSHGNVSKVTIDKIAELNKKIVDICFDHIQTSPLVRELLREMTHKKIEFEKTGELMRLKSLQIPLNNKG